MEPNNLQLDYSSLSERRRALALMVMGWLTRGLKTLPQANGFERVAYAAQLKLLLESTPHWLAGQGEADARWACAQVAIALTASVEEVRDDLEHFLDSLPPESRSVLASWARWVWDIQASVPEAMLAGAARGAIDEWLLRLGSVTQVLTPSR